MSTPADGKTVATVLAETHRESLVYSMLKHDLRHKILIRAGERPWSPSEIAEDIGEPLKRVSEQINVLLQQSPPFLELVEERPGPRGGPPRHFYRALVRVNVTVQEWERLTPHEQAQQTVTITEELHKEWIDSIECGAFYTDPHHCLMRTAMTIDAEGMEAIDEMLREVQGRFAEVEQEAAERRSETGTDAIRVITGLASFRAASK
jgi:hypothetical protein